MFNLFEKIGLPFPTIESISIKGKKIDILRLDKIDPYISGNKIFKLKYNVEEALNKNLKIATFGGAYSNHILATAFLGYKLQIPTLGIIRGEELADKPLNSTLRKSSLLGMELDFVSRSMYKVLKKDHEKRPMNNHFIIPEGGNNWLGRKGCQEILNYTIENYQEIYVAMGTSGTFLGIAESLKEKQHLFGIPVLKGINFNNPPQTTILSDYHWGGYAKFDRKLLDFISDIWKKYRLPLDPIYTAKSFYACVNKTKKEYKTLWIHTGGIQANIGFNEKFNFNLPTIEESYSIKL